MVALTYLYFYRQIVVKRHRSGHDKSVGAALHIHKFHAPLQKKSSGSGLADEEYDSLQLEDM